MTQEEKNLSGFIVEALKTRGMTLEKLSQLSGVSEGALELLLEERFDKLPSAPYIHGYLMKIAEVLNIDGKELWQHYLKNNEELRRSGEEDTLPLNRFITPQINKKVVIIAACIIVIGGYFILRLPSLLGKPELNLRNLDENQIIATSPQFTIEGSMDPADKLTVNGEVIYPDKDGLFKKDVSLQPGFNTFIFEVKKLLGSSYTITKQVFYETQKSNNNGSTQQ